MKLWRQAPAAASPCKWALRQRFGAGGGSELSARAATTTAAGFARTSCRLRVSVPCTVS